ncbi:hypothetical protein [Stenotrophomonas maltophilia]|uniref:hypothetical protein n=1 Tax=Stenotrophomonas maltophilia TaxID=40324 RepID=UPI000DA9F4E9|nr:hypothetical protein [Stenotrophomonas maltophilia]PZS57409.1 hypothetical protein A7X58_10340 [Stenotrophomonas maltophilia]HEL3178393.1 hypothetical protein [Stenotrophomonas maltophilia]
MDGSKTEEQKRYDHVKEYSWRLYGLHAAARLLGSSGMLTTAHVERATAADAELRKVLENLKAEVIALPGPLDGQELWVSYRGQLMPRDGEAVYKDRWHVHLLDPSQPMFPTG